MSEMLIINICFFCNENNKKEWSGFFSLRCLPHEKPCPRDQRHKDKLSVPSPPTPGAHDQRETDTSPISNTIIIWSGIHRVNKY